MRPLDEDPEVLLARFRDGAEHEPYRRGMTPFLSDVATVLDNPWCMPIRVGVEVEAMMDEVRTRSKLFDTLRDTLEATRKTFEGSSKVYLRTATGPHQRMPHGELHRFVDVEKVATLFPKIMDFVRDFANGREVGFVVINRMDPGAKILRHFDRGSCYLFYDRYHLVLETEGTWMFGPEDTDKSVWHTGELWWLNNTVSHHVENPWNSYRYHLTFDVMPDKNKELRERVLPFVGYAQ